MPGKPPKFRAYLSDNNGDIPLDGDGHWIEYAALWENRKPDRHGNLSYSGPVGNGGQRLLIFEVPPRNEQRFEGNAPAKEDTPF